MPKVIPYLRKFVSELILCSKFVLFTQTVIFLVLVLQLPYLLAVRAACINYCNKVKPSHYFLPWSSSSPLLLELEQPQPLLSTWIYLLFYQMII